MDSFMSGFFSYERRNMIRHLQRNSHKRPARRGSEIRVAKAEAELIRFRSRAVFLLVAVIILFGIAAWFWDSTNGNVLWGKLAWPIACVLVAISGVPKGYLNSMKRLWKP